MKVELRWFKSVDDGDYQLQYREAYYEEWKDVPRVLEGVVEYEGEGMKNKRPESFQEAAQRFHDAVIDLLKALGLERIVKRLNGWLITLAAKFEKGRKKLLCKLFDHKMKYAEPGDITSAADCLRCDYKRPKLQWPRRTKPAIKPALTEGRIKDFQKGAVEDHNTKSPLSPPPAISKENTV